MDLKVEKGMHTLGPQGLPQQVEGLEELLQNACLRLSLHRGEFPYGRELGSGLHQWEAEGEHAIERALALANEALLDLPGVQAENAAETEDGVRFTLRTPLGEGDVTVWKALKAF